MLKYLRKWRGLIAFLLTVIIYAGYSIYTSRSEPHSVTLTEFNNLITGGKITTATLKASETEAVFTLTLANGDLRSAHIPAQSLENYLSRLEAANIVVNVDDPPRSWGEIIGSIFTFLILQLLVSAILSRILKKGEDEEDEEDDEQSPFSLELGNIVAPRPKTSHVKFADVAGIDEIRGELEQIVEFIKDSKRLTALGGHIPRGSLLVGPAGTGKTLLAKAVAGEAGVPFYPVSASSVDGGFVGDGSKFFRRTFKAAKKSAKKHGASIIFIDEIDAVGRKRSEHDSKWAAQSLNQLLIEMDGFEENATVFVLGATNRVEDLDPALRRPGRFDREIRMRLPDLTGRKQILEVVIRKRNAKLTEGTDLTAIARGLTGFTGAEVTNLFNEAAIKASQRKDEDVTITEDDFEYAREKITMGLPNPMFMSEAERRVTAIHEAGHALIALALEDDLDPVYKATIVPRGNALGMVSILPDEDRTHITLRRLKARLALTFGGRMAEELFAHSPDDITAGASSDLQQITHLASRMILEWGFGKASYRAFRHAADEHNGTLGDTMHISPAQQEKLDQEIDSLIQTTGQRVRSIMEANKDILKKMADELFEKETLEGDYLRSTYKPSITVPPYGVTESPAPQLARPSGTQAAE